MRRPVFESVTVPAAFEQVGRRFADPPAEWLPAPAVQESQGTLVRMRAGRLELPTVDALVEVGAVTREGRVVVRSVAWRAVSVDRLFPRFVGELEVADATPTSAILTLVGGYKPPISVLGGAADVMLGHRVAVSTIRTFLLDVAARLAGQGLEPGEPH